MKMSFWERRSSRRRFLTRSGLLSVLTGSTSGRFWGQPSSENARAGEHVGIYERLGVRTRINAKGVYTYLSGSLLPQEVAQALEEASRHFAGQTHLKLRRVQILCQSQRSI